LIPIQELKNVLPKKDYFKKNFEKLPVTGFSVMQSNWFLSLPGIESL
jgi:hypothetical protein